MSSALPPLIVCRAGYRGFTKQHDKCWDRDHYGLIMDHHEATGMQLFMGEVLDDALISRSRSKLMSAFADYYTDREVMIGIDADVTWQPGDIQRLARSCAETRGIVGGIYSKRCFNGGVAVHPTHQTIKEGEFAVGVDKLFTANAVSAGFWAIHRDAVDAVAVTLPYVYDNAQIWQYFCQPFMVRQGVYNNVLSEDYAFCERAKRLGVPVHIDAKTSLGHVGEHEYKVATAFPVQRHANA